MREGYTTGACATAAAKAATIGLVTGTIPETVTIHLPAGRDATFVLHERVKGDGVRCSVIKDAGDASDLTHGAEICVVVQRGVSAGI